MDNLYRDIKAIRENSPLVHNITNYVVMNNTANALLSIGASPVMAHAVEEVAEMAGFASSLVINIGTLSEKWIEAMLIAGKVASERNIPIILDPVGAGATKLRTETTMKIIDECRPSIIRGNASEILAVTSSFGKTKGVDSTQSSDSAVDSAKQFAIEKNVTMVISGEKDYIINENETKEVPFGNAMMAKVTGMGCTATAICGAFAGINSNPLDASYHAMLTMGICGEIAAVKAEGPGTLQLHFLDALYNIKEKDIAEFRR